MGLHSRHAGLARSRSRQTIYSQRLVPTKRVPVKIRPIWDGDEHGDDNPEAIDAKHTPARRRQIERPESQQSRQRQQEMKKFLAKVQVPPFHSCPAADVQQLADSTPENFKLHLQSDQVLDAAFASFQDCNHMSYLTTSAIPHMCEYCERASIELQYVPTRNYLLSSTTKEESAGIGGGTVRLILALVREVLRWPPGD